MDNSKALLAAALTIPLLIVITLFVVFGADFDGGCTSSTPQPASVVTGLDRLTPRQQQIAAIIIGRGQLRKLPSKALVIAVAVGQDESNLLNLANPSVPESMSLPNDGMGHDHASVGVFQQQPWWGSIPDLMNPAVASDKFYDALLKVPDWQAMPVATAAATVQRNLNGAADYARYEAAASQIVTRIAPALAPVNDMAACAAFGSSAIGRRIAAAAASQIGVTYAWGGGDITGPTQGKHGLRPSRPIRRLPQNRLGLFWIDAMVGVSGHQEGHRSNQRSPVGGRYAHRSSIRPTRRPRVLRWHRNRPPRRGLPRKRADGRRPAIGRESPARASRRIRRTCHLPQIRLNTKTFVRTCT